MGKARNLADLLSDGAIGTSEIANNAVTDAKIAGMNASKLSGDVATARLGSGTANSTTFLRGDRTWQTIAASPTTDQVLAATAGASVGAVGTYAFLASAASIATGNTVAGSSTRYAGSAAVDSRWDSQNGFVGTGGAPAGTWRLMSFQMVTVDNDINRTTIGSSLFLRIS